VAYTIASEPRILIGSILTPCEPTLHKILFNLNAIALDQRPDDSVSRNRRDTRQTPRTRASQQSVQYRLGLIGSGMPRRDAVNPARFHQSEIKASTGASPSLLEIAADRSHVDRFGGEGQIHFRCQSTNEIGISLGFLAAQLVIQVKDRKGYAHRRRNRAHHV